MKRKMDLGIRSEKRQNGEEENGEELLVLFITSVVLLIFGGLLFASGFFLTRVEVPNSSNCEEPPSDVRGFYSGDGCCWMPSSLELCNNSSNPHRRLIVLVVDALRFDYLFPLSHMHDSTNIHGRNPFYHDKMQHVGRLVRDDPHHALLLQLVSDTPTVTMQRIKGFTTGGFPTFFDLSDLNFQSQAIKEDNLIRQLRLQGRRLAFIGDDTWVQLYPDGFDIQLPFPSFDAMDLHTVDDGVIANIHEVISNRSNDVVIAHMLGVDHIGHKHGPNHPSMETKLRQIDHLISQLVELLDERDLLLVFGDHGMTEDGNHGGASDSETQAGLFAFCKTCDFSAISRLDHASGEEGRRKPPNVVLQIDLVPTLSLLLGVAIPFGNLGKVSAELLVGMDLTEWMREPMEEISQSMRSRLWQLITAYQLNSHQILRYLKSYALISSQFPADFVDEAEHSLLTIDQQFQHHFPPNLSFPSSDATSFSSELKSLCHLSLRYSEWIDFVQDTSRTQWASFSLEKMIAGLVFIFIALVCQTLLSFGWLPTSRSHLRLTVVHTAVALAFGFLTSFVLRFPSLSDQMSWAFVTLLPIVLLHLNSIGGVLLLPLLRLLADTLRIGVTDPVAVDREQQMGYPFPVGVKEDIKNERLWLGSRIVAILFRSLSSSEVMPENKLAGFLVAVHLLALLSNSFIEREGMVIHFLLGLLDFSVMLSLAVKEIRSSHQQRYSLGSQGWLWLLLIMLLHRMMQHKSLQSVSQTHSQGESVQQLPGREMLWSMASNSSPLLSSATLFLHFLKHKDLRVIVCLTANLVSSIFTVLYWQLSAQTEQLDEEQRRLELFYPRAIYLSLLISVLFCAAHSLRLAFRKRTEGGGPGSATGGFFPGAIFIASLSLLTLLWGSENSLFSLLFCLYSLFLCRMGDAGRSSKAKERLSSSFLLAVNCCLQSLFYFFESGHYCDFSAVQFGAAFIGLQGFNYGMGAFLVLFHTFGSVVVSYSVLVMTSSGRPSRLFCLFAWLFGLNFGVTAVFVFFQRHHLMVWRVFAPKFVFDGLFAIISQLLVALSFLVDISLWQNFPFPTRRSSLSASGHHSFHAER